MSWADLNWIEIGVTGTRNGAQRRQLYAAAKLVVDIYNTEGPVRIHQGCCVGFDTEITSLLRREIPPHHLYVCGHPPKNEALLSPLAIKLSDNVEPAEEFLVRDRHIVRDGTRLLIGAPKEYLPRGRGSGTWYTMRWAYTHKHDLRCVYPNGLVVNGFEAFRGRVVP